MPMIGLIVCDLIGNAHICLLPSLNMRILVFVAICFIDTVIPSMVFV